MTPPSPLELAALDKMISDGMSVMTVDAKHYRQVLASALAGIRQEGGSSYPVVERSARSVDFQARVKPWMDVTFGPEISADRVERNDRFIEEALELVQASGYTAERAHALVDYTFNRPQGEINQEVGGVMVTLAAHCLAHGLDMHAAAETELARIWTKIDQIRAKQLTKPKHSPLPAPPTDRAESGDEPGTFQVLGDTVREAIFNGRIQDAIEILKGHTPPPPPFDADVEAIRLALHLTDRTTDAHRAAWAALDRLATAPPTDRAGPSATDYDPIPSDRLAAPGWRPIESAPKDGTLIILLGAAYTNPGDDFGGPYHHPARVALGHWDAKGDAWVDQHSQLGGESYTLAVTGVWLSDGGWFQPNEVTHWQPLPPPPTDEMR